MKIRPRKNTVLVKIVIEDNESKILVPESSKESVSKTSMIIKEISKDLLDAGTDLKIGDEVITVHPQGFSGVPVLCGDDKCFIVEDEEIIGVKE